MGKAARKKTGLKPPSDNAMMTRVKNRKCLHCDRPLDWNEDDLQGKPRTWHCRFCTARGKNTRKIMPTHEEKRQTIKNVIEWLEQQEVA